LLHVPHFILLLFTIPVRKKTGINIRIFTYINRKYFYIRVSVQFIKSFTNFLIILLKNCWYITWKNIQYEDHGTISNWLSFILLKGTKWFFQFSFDMFKMNLECKIYLCLGLVNMLKFVLIKIIKKTVGSSKPRNISESRILIQIIIFTKIWSSVVQQILL
jgi:hypothetical protein